MKRKKSMDTVFTKEDMFYADIINKVDDKKEFIKLHKSLYLDEIDILDYMNGIDELIKDINISEDTLIKLEHYLKNKLTNQNYTVEDVISEIDILNSDKFTLNQKNNLIKSLRNRLKKSSINKPIKRKIPKDLEKYSNRNCVRKIIINPVGTKR